MTPPPSQSPGADTSMDAAARAPVETVEELETLSVEEMVEGYRDGYDGEREPGDNRSKAYWHGWRNGATDGKHRKSDSAQAILAQRVVRNSAGARAAAPNSAPATPAEQARAAAGEE